MNPPPTETIDRSPVLAALGGQSKIADKRDQAEEFFCAILRSIDLEGIDL